MFFQPSDPIRPVSPVRPVSPIDDHSYAHLLKPIQQLNIPRIDVHSAPPSHSPRHGQYTFHCFLTWDINFPLCSITKKSRLVSVHDGRSVAPYTETVTYEPAFLEKYSSASARSKRSGFSSNSLSPRIRRESDDSCAYIVQNPLYRD
ncbi:unnamed protein product [Angiostrongylus costaricensis]|uniref:DUF4005 domain-containing protein n=1 Tax=Angiostrongylus costaricensis TaxID=334426 RepID=A0A0R3PCM7_ANGCS|nr:unnamed protein product [Angiostrongylus costaricensis]